MPKPNPHLKYKYSCQLYRLNLVIAAEIASMKYPHKQNSFVFMYYYYYNGLILPLYPVLLFLCSYVVSVVGIFLEILWYWKIFQVKTKQKQRGHSQGKQILGNIERSIQIGWIERQSSVPNLTHLCLHRSA